MSKASGQDCRELHGLVRLLRKRCPADRPVYVRITYLRHRLLGDAYTWRSRSGKRAYFIRIHRDQGVDGLYDTLIHEWAHLLDIHTPFTADDFRQHGRSWGIAYAKVYRVYLEYQGT